MVPGNSGRSCLVLLFLGGGAGANIVLLIFNQLISFHIYMINLKNYGEIFFAFID